MNRIADALAHQNKSIIIKEALANGRVFRNANFKQYTKLYDALELLANKYNVGVDIIALKFAKTTIPKAMVLSGASNREHLLANLKMKAIRLKANDIELLKSFAIAPTTY